LKYLFSIPILVLFPFVTFAQLLPGFKAIAGFREQQMVIENDPEGTRILINAPATGFGPRDKVLLVFYALPNGNSIEQTFGKRLREGDDWHYDIQHIGAQTRFLRQILKERTLVVAYLETKQHSWPAWKAQTPGYDTLVRNMVEDITLLFTSWNPEIVLTGHSGGGRFIFSYLDAVEKIPDRVTRISFLDSNYGYEDAPCGKKLLEWVMSGRKYLCTLAYNDSLVIFNGKPLVSPTGGTWYRSRLMLKFLQQELPFRTRKKDSLIWHKALKNRVEVILKPNPQGKIFHTVQVERNGFIHSMLNGTRHEEKKYSYFGDRVYNHLIADSLQRTVRRLNFPALPENSEPGTLFMKRITLISKTEREEEILNAISGGNLPGFIRNTVTLSGEFSDANGTLHQVIMEVMPDYLMVGNDIDFYRIPMNPYTAQRIADLTGGSLITSKISDYIDRKAEIRLPPYNYIPVGDLNERVDKFMDHHWQIEKMFDERGGIRGKLTSGIKKDIILSGRLAKQPGKVVIYGWHLPDGKPVQPVYSGHAAHYVDYSHGIRLMNNQIILDGKPALLSDMLKDPVLFRIFSDEEGPMEQPYYKKP
jgi:hypothetical protein